MSHNDGPSFNPIVVTTAGADIALDYASRATGLNHRFLGKYPREMVCETACASLVLTKLNGNDVTMNAAANERIPAPGKTIKSTTTSGVKIRLYY